MKANMPERWFVQKCTADEHADPDSFDGTMCEDCAPDGPTKESL